MTRRFLMVIREMLPRDWDSVFEIYKQGIDSGKTTFSTSYPSWNEWDSGHFRTCRYVALLGEIVTGFIAISPVSAKPHYHGVAEVSIYVDSQFRHQGIGFSLLSTLIESAPANGFWCLYSSIFSSNTESIRLHTKCGFRMIGYRERIAKDRFGNWVDTTLMEYRFPD